MLNVWDIFHDPNFLAPELSYAVVGDSNPGLFAQPPAIGPHGALSLQYTAATYGSSTITVRATNPEQVYADCTFLVTATAFRADRE